LQMMAEQKEDVQKAVGCDKQTTIKLVTKYKDSDGKEQTNESDIPQLGLGTWRSVPDKLVAAVEYALKVGYKHVDCAHCYGNEKEVGQALTKCFNDGVAKREDVFITSKLWNTDHHPDDVAAGVEETLQNLNLQYLDLYLMHWPYNFKRTRAEYAENLKKLDAEYQDKSNEEYVAKLAQLQLQVRFPKNEDGSMQYGDVVSIMDTWRAMEKLVVDGKVKHIGLSNFNKAQVAEILKESTIKPAMLQCECHPYLNQHELVSFCHENGMQFTCYSPLGSPTRPNQNHYYPVLLENETVSEIANKFKEKTSAHVLIRFAVDRNLVVIPKSVTPKRIKANLEVFDIKLEDEDMKKLLALNRNLRYCAPTSKLDDGSVIYRDGKHPNFPFADETVMSEKDFKK